ncbi:hypothetical protein [Arthrobacter sp. ok362]|jgi:hypothetical protein|uniref:hypothetical protein n=1 Tax=Arthrobacter sp. ok362 TaxID=1761745 RepID=UPI000883E4F5|nr:hypothetical protein [Arthrobacter sp. ok362]SDL25969.1 hypothetical protein SAMN04487913_107203 [Arthrobacter sp. ok362]
MSEEPNERDKAQDGVGHDDSIPGAGDLTTELDPAFIPAESDETPAEKRAREHPEATGS